MRKKENLWQLLTRLDEEASEYNTYLTEANRYFDTTSKVTKKILLKHEQDLHNIIRDVKKALKPFIKKSKKE